MSGNPSITKKKRVNTAHTVNKKNDTRTHSSSNSKLTSYFSSVPPNNVNNTINAVNQPTATTLNVLNNNNNSNDNNQHVNTVQTREPLFLESYSNDSTLQLQLNIQELLRLPESAKSELRHSPVHFLTNTITPLLYISKQMEMQAILPYEIHHNNTPSNGFCYHIMLLQLMTRHQQQYQTQIPVEIDLYHNPRHREILATFISTMIVDYVTCPEDPEVATLEKALALLRDQHTSLDSCNYMGLDSIHSFKFPFPVTGWAKQSPLGDYLALVYSNSIGPEYAFLGHHAITFTSFRTITHQPNDFHHNRDHFYTVPAVATQAARLDNLTQAISNIVPHILQILRRHEPSPANLPSIYLESSRPNQVTLANNWLRISLHTQTITTLSLTAIVSSLKDPLLFLLETNIPIFAIDNNPTLHTHTQLSAILAERGTVDNIDQPETWLLRGLITLSRRLLLLVPQLSTNYIPSGLTDTHFPSIKACDQNSLIQLEIDAQKLPLYMHYSSTDAVLQAIRSNITPTITLRKRIQDELYHNTLPNGHCFPLALHQSWQRNSTTPYTPSLTPTCLQHITSQTDRHVYQQWLLKLKRECNQQSLPLCNQLQAVHDSAHSSNPRTQWFDPYIISALTISWRMTLWNNCSNTQYCIPIWSNRLTEDLKTPNLLTSFNYSQVILLLRGTNDIEISNHHYYLLPSSTSAHLLIAMEEALRNLAFNIFRILNTLRTHQSTPHLPAASPSTPNSNGTSTSSTLQNNPSRAHRYFEPSYRTYDLPLLLNTSVIDPFFTSSTSRDILVHQLKVSTNLSPTCYPDKQICRHLQYLLMRTIARQSTVCSEMGLFANLSAKYVIQPGELIGIYSGQRTTQRNSYSMHITTDFEIGDVPDPTDEWTKFGYINEYIWDRDKCNCVIDAYGVIRAIKLIKHSDELFFSYGTEYRWDHLKAEYHYTLLESLVTMTQSLPSAPPSELIRDTYTNALQSASSSGFNQLLTDFFAHDADDPQTTFPLHDTLPTYHNDGNILEWIEIVLRCRWFYEQQCFRKHQAPQQKVRGIQGPIDNTHSNRKEPLRRSTRTKPIVSYVGHQDNDDDNPVRSAQRSAYYLHSDIAFPIRTLYQFTDTSTTTVPSTSIPTTTMDTEPSAPQSLEETLPGEPYPNVSPSSSNSQYEDPGLHHPHAHPTHDSPPLSSLCDDETNAQLLDKLADRLVAPRPCRRPPPSTLTTLTYNINGPNEMRQREIITHIRNHNVDITTLIDIRIASGSQTTYARQLRAQLGQGYAILVFPTQPDDKSTQLIGGTAIILSRRISKYSAKEIFPMGALIQLNCHFGTQALVLFSIYIPTRNPAAGSFQTRLANYLQIASSRIHPLLHQTLSDAVILHQSQSISVIVTGDFNSNLTKRTNTGTDLLYLFENLQLRHAATENELEQPSFERGQQTSRIDFTIFHGHLRPTKSKCLLLDTFQNDHLPLLTKFDIPGQSRPFEPILGKPGVPRFDYRDPKQLSTLEQLLTQIDTHPELPPTERINRITAQTLNAVEATYPTKQSHRGLKPETWSPANRSLAITLKALVLINRHVHGYRRYYKWTESDYGQKLHDIRTQWKGDITAMGKNEAEETTLLQVTEYGPDFWVHMSLTDIQEHLLTAIPTVRKLSSSKLKQQRREEYLEVRARREFKFQIQQIGEPIHAILKKHRQAFTMEDLIINEHCTTRPGLIATAITKKFRDDWFNFPQGASEIPWNKCLNDRILFMNLTITLGIKPPEAEVLWKAIEQRPTSPRVAAFHEAVMQTPSFNDYMTQINWASIDSAGGMSGLTYAMMKSWPTHVHEEIYKALVENWTDKHIPDDWKWRWLLPIPKAPNPTLSQLRPICLLEVLRKLWSKIFIQRITNFMHKEQVLHPGQHSGKGKGTDSAVLEFAAVLETAKELKTELFVSSWDVSRAYDSVDRQVLLFAWTRAGVPYPLALYLVEMDMAAIMVIQTPLAMVTHMFLGKEGLTKNGLSFHPDRGTAQGGVDSSLVYAAFLDILLCAIDIANDPDDTFYISDIDGNLEAAKSIAYVDDLVCATATSKGLQSVANIVSAFCILFQMELNATKFRAFAINWGNEHQQDMSTMVIYTKGWTPMTINMQHDGTMTHLGVDWDMSLHNTTMFEKVKQTAQTSLELVVKSPHSAAVRLATIQISIMNQLVYETKFTTWSLAQYQEIDILFNKAYRLITHNQRSFPTKALYMDKTHLGLEFPQFSTQAQIAKFHLLQRSTFGTNERRQFIINSLTARVLRQMGCQPCRYGPYSLTIQDPKNLPKETRDTWWFTSLAQHMSLMDLTIERDSLSIVPLPMHLPHEIRNTLTRNAALINNNITLPHELHMEGDLPPTLDTLGLGWALDLVLPVTSTPIRQGQVWATFNSTSQTYNMFEIVGFRNDNTTVYLNWQCLEFGEDGQPTKVSLPNGTGAMRGAGSTYSADTSELFETAPNLTYYLVHLGIEKYCLGANTSHCKSLRIRQPLIPQRTHTSTTHPWFLDVASELTTHSIITPQNTILDRLMGHKCTEATTILVKTDHSTEPWTRHALIIEHVHRTHEPTKTAHVMALFIAASQSKQARQTFTSTSKVGQALHRTSINKPVADPLAPLLQPTKAHRMFPLAPLNETRMDALKLLRKDPHRLLDLNNDQQSDTNLQTQLFIERTLNLTLPQLQQHHPNSTITLAHESDFTLHLRQYPTGQVCNATDHSPFLDSYSSQYSNHMSSEYYRTRDQYRQHVHNELNKVNPDPQYWTNSSHTLAGDALRRIPNGASRAMVTRLVLDWHATGNNKLKRSLDPLDAKCLLCDAAVEDQQHILCHCTHKHLHEVRQTHMKMITKILDAHPKESFTTRLLRAFHSEAIKPDNYELLIGRIHTHNFHSMDSLPVASSSEQANAAYSALVAHSRLYLAMAIDLYQTRQNLLTQLQEPPDERSPTHTFDPIRQRIIASETLMGIHSRHFLRPDGTKITKQIDGSPLDTMAQKRNLINETNSIFCRKEFDFFAKRTKIDDARQEKERDINALKLITKVDQQEWTKLHDPHINVHDNNIHPHMESLHNTEQDEILARSKALALDLYSNSATTRFPEFAHWFAPPSITKDVTMQHQSHSSTPETPSNDQPTVREQTYSNQDSSRQRMNTPDPNNLPRESSNNHNSNNSITGIDTPVSHWPTASSNQQLQHNQQDQESLDNDKTPLNNNSMDVALPHPTTPSMIHQPSDYKEQPENSFADTNYHNNHYNNNYNHYNNSLNKTMTHSNINSLIHQQPYHKKPDHASSDNHNNNHKHNNSIDITNPDSNITSQAHKQTPNHKRNYKSIDTTTNNHNNNNYNINNDQPEVLNDTQNPSLHNHDDHYISNSTPNNNTNSNSKSSCNDNNNYNNWLDNTMPLSNINSLLRQQPYHNKQDHASSDNNNNNNNTSMDITNPDSNITRSPSPSKAIPKSA